MKQPVRLLAKPSVFFNQLQWSSNHWFILATFLIASMVEIQLGTRSNIFQWYANFLSVRFGIEGDSALWLVTLARFSILIVGAWLTTVVVWLVGKSLGYSSSQRVLFRRLAVVFTILLSAYTSQLLASEFDFGMPLAVLLYVWGAVLGFLAIREQFHLDHLHTSIVGVFTALVVGQLWFMTNDLLRVNAAEVHADLVYEKAKSAPVVASPKAGIKLEVAKPKTAADIAMDPRNYGDYAPQFFGNPFKRVQKVIRYPIQSEDFNRRITPITER